jgi:cobalamin biosynthesis Co2+ chelatase CbiK
MLKRIVSRLVRKHGMVGLLLMIGDHAVRATKSKKDDEIWEEVKSLLKGFEA